MGLQGVERGDPLHISRIEDIPEQRLERFGLKKQPIVLSSKNSLGFDQGGREIHLSYSKPRGEGHILYARNTGDQLTNWAKSQVRKLS